MNNMFGQNNRNNRDNRNNTDADLMRVREQDQTGPRDQQGNRQFDPGRATFREQNHQEQGRGNGTDAPPTYEEAMQDAPPTYDQVMQGDRAQRRRQTARRFMRRVAEYGVLSQISAADALMFNNWLYRPDGRLHLDRALLLAHFERQYNNRRASQDKPSEKELLEFFKFCARKLNEQQEAEKKEVKKVEADPSDPNSPAFEAGYEAGYESLEKREGYFSDSGYSSDSDVESDF